jgi:protein-disulfide isomerase
MQMFIDVQCPFCRDYETNNLPTLVRKYIRTGEVRLDLKPWAFLGSQSFSGRLGLIAASFQNKGFEFAKLIYDNWQPENSGWLNGQMLASIAASVTGLNLSQWRTDTNGPRPKPIASQVDALASQKKVSGTPTVLVGHTGGTLTTVGSSGFVPTLQQTEQAINKVLSGT